MGYRALGPCDQCEVFDCAMGEGPYTIEIDVKNTRKKHWRRRLKEVVRVCISLEKA